MNFENNPETFDVYCNNIKLILQQSNHTSVHNMVSDWSNIYNDSTEGNKKYMEKLFTSMMLLSTLFDGNKIPYYGLYGVGILGIIASNIMMLISFSRIKMESMTGQIPLSKSNRKRLDYYALV